MKTYALLVQVTKVKGVGYRAECPALPGCFVDGESLHEVVADMQEAIALYIAASRERGLPLPDLAPARGKELVFVLPVSVA